MKTIKISSAVSTALIVCAITLGSFTSFAINGGSTSATPVITFQVNVNLGFDARLSNIYLVEIVDNSGQLVAPAQIFNQKVSKYSFYERGPATGSRTAMIVQAPENGSSVGGNIMLTIPVTINGPFKAGDTYRFDLFPLIQSTIKN